MVYYHRDICIDARRRLFCFNLTLYIYIYNINIYDDDGGEKVTIQQCLYGDGIQKILDFFMAKIQSNKNCIFEAGTLVKIYSIDTSNFVNA